jgi:hypothetical protein
MAVKEKPVEFDPAPPVVPAELLGAPPAPTVIVYTVPGVKVVVLASNPPAPPPPP